MGYNYFHTVILPLQSYVQETLYTCGAAVLRDVFKTRGVRLSEQDAVHIVDTQPDRGTPPDALLDALDSYGLPYKVYTRATVVQVEESIRAGNICLVVYQAWPASSSTLQDLNGGHWSIIFGFNKTHLFLADPAKHKMKVQRRLGFRTIEKKRFEKFWVDKAWNKKIYVHWMVTVPVFERLLEKKKQQKMKLKVVNGGELRNTTDVDFSMIGDRDIYPYIPKGEVWLDQCFIREKESIVMSFTMKKHLMRIHGYEAAKKIMREALGADAPKPVGSVRRQLISKDKKISIYLVSGAKVREQHDPSFCFGGHGYVYSYIPKKEIWIDDAVEKTERKYVMIHEQEEYERMKRGMSYDSAHDYANAVEKHARRTGGAAHYIRD